MQAQHMLVPVVMLLATTTVQAQQALQGAEHVSHPVHATASAPKAPLSTGEVRKVDVAQAKVTLRHGPLANLDMPAMTMVFTVADKKLLDGIQQGDKVRFTAEKHNGVFLVTAIERAQ